MNRKVDRVKAPKLLVKLVWTLPPDRRKLENHKNSQIVEATDELNGSDELESKSKPTGEKDYEQR
jgi:hypothetical protein